MSELSVRSGAADGEVGKGDSTNYTTTHDAATGEYVAAGLAYVNIGQQYPYLTTKYLVVRTVLQFDTSSIGSGQVVTAATLKFKVSGVIAAPPQDFYITLVDGSDAEDTLEEDDYGDLLPSTTSGGSTVYTSPWVTDSEKTITLNATGLAWINMTGTTKLCLRSDRDIASTVPTERERTTIHGGGNSTEALRPLLTVTYSPALPDTPTNSTPADEATDQEVHLALTSSAYSGAGDHTGSQWQITDTEGDYSSPVYDSGDDDTNLVSIFVRNYLSYEAVYYWRVRHKNATGWSEYSTETSFTVKEWEEGKLNMADRKALAEYLGDLRSDLKDSGVVWENAELTRCIHRAVADLSRFLPREAVYEETISYAVTDESVTTPAAADPDGIVDAADISASVAGDTLTITDVTLDVPRQVKLTITDANDDITRFSIIVKGTDQVGNTQQERFHFAGGLVQIGQKYFTTVTEVEIDDIAGNTTNNVLDLGTSNAYDAYVWLANKPVEPESETVTTTDAATTYDRDTDYRMDYANGRIKYMTGGSMDAATEYYIDYTKSRIHLDLAEINPEFINIMDVIYPAGDVPQTGISVRKWGSVITIEGSGIDSQERVTDKEHMVVHYHARHTPPSDGIPGSYPAFLDDTVILASSAYALFMKALQYEHQAVTDFASCRTAAGDTSFTDLTGALTNAAAELGKVTVESAGTALVDMDTALVSTKKYLDNNSDADAAGILADIVTDAASLKTAIETALSDAPISTAKSYLATGDAYIPTINTGENVPENYLAYAQGSMGTFNSLIAEANVRLSHLRTYIERAQSYSRIADSFTAEADRRATESAGWLAIANMYVANADRYIAQAAGYFTEIQGRLALVAQYESVGNSNLSLADRYRAEGVERRNEAWSVWRDSKSFIGDFSLSALRQPEYYTGGRTRVSETRL